METLLYAAFAAYGAYLIWNRKAVAENMVTYAKWLNPTGPINQRLLETFLLFILVVLVVFCLASGAGLLGERPRVIHVPAAPN